MRYWKLSIIILLTPILIMSCKPEKKEMTLEDFYKIDQEISLPDPNVNMDLVKKITEKFGYSSDEYIQFSNRVEKDAALQEKLGEMRLRDQQE